MSIEIILILNKEKNEKAKINSFSHCCDGYVYRLWNNGDDPTPGPKPNPGNKDFHGVVFATGITNPRG